MKVITVCGSLKYKEEMMDSAMMLELAGNVVLIPIFPISHDTSYLSEEDFQILGNMHKEKIRLSDAIFVVDVDGYIGNSTKSEIAFAKKLHKEILYYSDFKKEDSTILAEEIN